MLDQGRRHLDLRPFGNEVSQDMGFDGGAWSVSDDLPHQLKGSSSNPPFCFRGLDHLFEWVFRNHRDWVCVKIVPELSFGDQHGINELLDLRTEDLGVRKYLTDKVDRPMHFQHFVGLVALDHQSHADDLSHGSDV
jgi:hypothetical protein